MMEICVCSESNDGYYMIKIVGTDVALVRTERSGMKATPISDVQNPIKKNL